MTKSFVITWAQSGTPVHKPFWKSLQIYAKANGSEILVVPGRYKNPTSKWEAARAGEETWAAEVVPYLVTKRRSLSKNLVVYGDVKIQPTAVRPLTGFEVFTGSASGIFGHPKRAMECIATERLMPKILWTTGAVTVQNYSDSKAGIKGAAHHVLGALVGEVESDGRYFFRHVTWARDGFMDLDEHYDDEGYIQGCEVASVTLGDWHSGQTDALAINATKGLIDLVKPQHVVLHDVLDFRTRNHHERNKRAMYARRSQLVESEVAEAVEDLNDIASWGDYSVHVVRSNHDEAFERWLEEFDPKTDAENAPYYHRMWAAAYEAFHNDGRWPNLFAMEAFRLQVNEKVTFLDRGDSLKIANVENGMHGDIGIGGSKGSVNGFVKLGCKLNIGHGHTPCIRDGVYVSGAMALDMGYNRRGPSSWLVAHTVTHQDGKRQMVVCIRDKFRGG